MAKCLIYSPCKPGFLGYIPGFSSLSDETLNRGPMTIFEDKLLKRIYCDEAGDYAVLSPIGLVFRPDLSDTNCTIIVECLAIIWIYTRLMI